MFHIELIRPQPLYHLFPHLPVFTCVSISRLGSGHLPPSTAAGSLFPVQCVVPRVCRSGGVRVSGTSHTHQVMGDVEMVTACAEDVNICVC